MKQLFVALRSALYASAFVALWASLALSLRSLDPRLGWVLPAWLRPVGLVLLILGGALALACVVVFSTAGRGTPAPFDPPRDFVAVGPYRLVRNPMYVGGFAVLLGAGLLLSSPAIVGLALVFWVFFHLFVVLYEEPTLERTFGESYRHYRQTVRRWWPVWRR